MHFSNKNEEKSGDLELQKFRKTIEIQWALKTGHEFGVAAVEHWKGP